VLNGEARAFYAYVREVEDSMPRREDRRLLQLALKFLNVIKAVLHIRVAMTRNS
jgi:hypothetical protein